MKRTSTVLTALAAATLASVPFAVAQAPAAAAPAPQSTAAAAAPQAVDAKIALINFQQVVLASNEGQVVTATTQKKYEPKKAELERLSKEIDSDKAGLTPTLSDADRAAKLRAIDLKEKHLNQEAQEASEAYNAEWQEALSKVAQKIAQTMRTYAQQQGFTILLDVSTESSNVLWALPSTDVSQAVVDLYNKQSGIAAPPPSAPSAARPAAPRPAAKPTGR